MRLLSELCTALAGWTAERVSARWSSMTDPSVRSSAWLEVLLCGYLSDASEEKQGTSPTSRLEETQTRSSTFDAQKPGARLIDTQWDD